MEFYPMDNVIAEYHKWKQQGETLRAQARQAMEARFRELLTEAARIAQEYHRDFGGALKPPPLITAFRFKPSATKGVKKTVAADPKVAALAKRLAQARARLETARTAGKATKNLEDRIYEIEDEIRLASQAG
jgi:hypothetical protein